MATIGANIREARKRAGYATGKAFAEAMGVDASRVSEWENDTYQPKIETLIRIAKFLECPVDELLSGIDAAYDEIAAATNERRVEPAELLKRIRETLGASDPIRGVKTTSGFPNAARNAEDVLAEIEALTNRKAADTRDAVGAFVDVSGSVPHDLPVVGEGEATPKGGLFWDDEGRLLAGVTDRIRRPYDVRDPHAYGVKVRGDSMIPVYEPGMIVVVSPRRPVHSGNRVYVELASGERLVKIARKAGDGWMLESANPAHAARFVKRSEIRLMHRIVWVREPDDGERLVDETTGHKTRRR
ncbi:MAG: XRE family transcriptional regulator [Vicinamibacterales bacterium]